MRRNPLAQPDDLLARFGSARRPGTGPAHPRPEGVTDAEVDAVGKLSAALEVVEQARGFLYGFHRLSGTADLSLQDAVRALREAGHGELADEIDEVLVGRDVVGGRWTFQIVEAYDEQYYRVFRAAEGKVRHAIMDGTPHILEAEMKAAEQNHGTPDDPAES